MCFLISTLILITNKVSSCFMFHVSCFECCVIKCNKVVINLSHPRDAVSGSGLGSGLGHGRDKGVTRGGGRNMAGVQCYSIKKLKNLHVTHSGFTCSLKWIEHWLTNELSYNFLLHYKGMAWLLIQNMTTSCNWNWGLRLSQLTSQNRGWLFPSR